MRFTVERTCLNQAPERRRKEDAEPFFGFTEASDIEEAVDNVLRRSDVDLVEEVQMFPGGQAIASVKKGSRFYLLHFAPDDGDFEEAIGPWGVSRRPEAMLR